MTPLQAILDMLDSTLNMRKRLQETSPQSEKEMSKMKEKMAMLKADLASLRAKEVNVATIIPTTPINASLKIKKAFAEAKSSLEFVKPRPTYISIGLTPYRAYNAKARAKNALVTTMNQKLEPLLNESGKQVLGFPINGLSLTCLSCTSMR